MQYLDLLIELLRWAKSVFGKSNSQTDYSNLRKTLSLIDRKRRKFKNVVTMLLMLAWVWFVWRLNVDPDNTSVAPCLVLGFLTLVAIFYFTWDKDEKFDLIKHYLDVK